MILLRLISWPYFRKHILRTVLTTAGIVLGVAVFVGMHTANQSVLFAFNRTVDRIAGKTELQVSAGETGFNEEILEAIQAASSVRVAVPVIEAVERFLTEVRRRRLDVNRLDGVVGLTLSPDDAARCEG